MQVLERGSTRRKFLQKLSLGGSLVVVSPLLVTSCLAYRQEEQLPPEAIRFQELMRERIKPGQPLEIVRGVVTINKGATRLRWFASPAYSDDIQTGPAVGYKGGSGTLVEIVNNPWEAIDHQKGQAWLIYRSGLDGNFTAVYLNDKRNLENILIDGKPYINVPATNGGVTAALESEAGGSFSVPLHGIPTKVDYHKQSLSLSPLGVIPEIFVKDGSSQAFRVMHSEILSK